MDDDASTSKDLKKRRITERRRQQGREAQKRYREKQKANRVHTSGAADEPYNASISIAMLKGPQTAERTDDHTFDELLLGSFPDFESSSWKTSFTTGMEEPASTPLAHDSIHGSNFARSTSASIQGVPSVVSDMSSPSIPMDSYVRVQRYSFYAASVENAFVLGVTFAQMQGHACGDKRLKSPWRLSETPSVDSIAPDLAAADGQKKYDHDLYIDCLPFKDFRDKLLAVRSVEPKIFDEDDFIRDIDFRDAFQCWGPTPWQSRSWEVKPWFLKKWWMITGGDDGEMATSSRWWRLFRGESM